MRAFLTLLLLILSGIAAASSPIDLTAIPAFPTIGDCHEYQPVGSRPWRGKLVAPPAYMECTTEEGVKFSISESDYYNGSSWLEWMGKGSDVQPEYDLLTIGDAMRPVSILDTAPFLIVSYKAPIGFQEVTVIFLRDKRNGTRPLLITTGRQSRTANHLKYAYQDQKNNWISNYQFTYMDEPIGPSEPRHEDGYKKKEIPSSFPYYAFSQLGTGAHCCFNIILIDKNKPHRVSHYWENMDFEPWFGDVNNDGEYEMFAPDYSYSYWPDSFAGSPAPRLVWRITPSGFSLAPDLMIEPPLDQATLRSKIEWIGDNVDSDSLYLPYELYSTTLDLIYSGNEQRAWKFFDDAWPTLIETKNQEDFRKDFKEMICSSLFADSLNAKKRDRFLEKTCGSYASEVTINHEGGTYTGEVSNGVPHGQGTLITLHGSKYFGEWKGGKRHSQGEQMYSGGANYVGEWREGSFWGHGTFTSADGSKHVGEWKYGQPNGQGTFTSSDGSMYVGEWLDSNMHGNGIYTYPSGDIYDGQWKLSTKHGHGTLTSTNGSKYVGHWKYGMKYGHGVYTWLDGSKYVGEFKDGKFHGDGVLTFDGSKYVGKFKHGEYQGPGSFNDKTGDQISNAATAGRLIELGTDARVTVYEYERDHKSEVYVQLGQNAIWSPTNTATAEIYIILDPFAPLGIPCGVDGHLKPKSFMRITSENSSELSASDFKTFSFFTGDKTTIGFVTTSIGSGGTFPILYYYDLKTKQSLRFRPGCDGELYWIDTAARPPVIGFVIGKYWFFPYPHDSTYAMRVSLIDKVWAEGQVLPDNDPNTRRILEEQFQKALSVWNESVMEELGTLAPGSRQSAVATDPWKYQEPLGKLMKYLYYAKRTGRVDEAKKVVELLHSEIREAITIHEPNWYQIINPYRS